MNRRIARSTPSKKASGRAGLKMRIPSIFRSNVPTASSVKETQAPSDAPSSVGIGYVLFVCVCLAIAAGGMLYHLHVRFEGVRLGYEASAQRKIQTKLMLKRRELRLELASMKEPGRIEDEAREKLGMETPRSEEFIHINKAKKVVSVSGGAL